MNEIKILVADDDPAICFAFTKTFVENNYTILTATNGIEAINLIKVQNPNVVFMDIVMPQMDGLDALEKIRKIDSSLPVIIITGAGDMVTAIKAMQIGAYDYLSKPLDIEKVRITTERALEMSMMKNKIEELKQKLVVTKKEEKSVIIGKNPKIQEIFKKVGVISTTPNSTNILILGATGTGKEVVAQAIHQNSSFSNEPFVAINCTVLPEDLLESELFGHEKGSFTGAYDRKLGKFELAGNGTILLDEIGDMPLKLQKKLLRVIEERSFERLGGNKVIKLNARIIASTHRDLKEAIKKEEFREDLYFRLNVIEIILPLLRERKDDIIILADYFLDRCNDSLNKKIKGISAAVLKALKRYEFPGNVRELKNIIERACTLERGSILTPQVFLPEIFNLISSNEIDIQYNSKNFNESKNKINQSFEKKFIKDRLSETNGNVTKAARISGIERQSFQRLMKKHNIHSSDFHLN